MHFMRLPSLALSFLIQLAPLLRVASADAALALSPVMAIIRWVAGAAAVAGSYHAVSGATVPTISSSKTKIGAVGVNFSYRILLSGGSPEAFEATPLPAGLAVNLIKTSSGRVTGAEIKGLPTEIGRVESTITAWDDPDFTGDQTSGIVSFVIADLTPMAPSIAAGQPVTFTVLGTQEANVTYRWIHNDIEVPSPEGTNASLTLPAVSDANAGQYRVRITFGNTSVFTQRATLTVVPSLNPPTFTETPRDAALHSGETLILRAAATGEGNLTFAWTRNGDSLPDQTSPILELPAVTPDDAGTYRATVTGTGGSATSGPAAVSVTNALAIGAVALEEGGFKVPFNGIAGRTYLLESRPALGSPEWSPTAELVAGGSSVFSVPGPESDIQVFRVRTQ